MHTQGKVVTPGWILDSVAAGKRLSESSYFVVRDPKQNQMESFLVQPTQPLEPEMVATSTAVPEMIDSRPGTRHADPALLVDANMSNTGTSPMVAPAALRDPAMASAVAQNVSNFHKKSRLHQMGVMKKAAQQHVKDSVVSCDSTIGQRRTVHLPSTRQRVVLHIDLDCFFAQVRVWVCIWSCVRIVWRVCACAQHNRRLYFGH